MIRRDFLGRVFRHGSEFLGLSYLAAVGFFFRKSAYPPDKHVAKQLEAEIDHLEFQKGAALIEMRAPQTTFLQNDEPVYGILIRQNKAFTLFSAECTHLSCQLQVKEKNIVCPCHNGVFDFSGAPVSGPPRKPLVRASELSINQVKNRIVIKAKFS